MIAFIPSSFEFLLSDEFVIFYTDTGSVDGCVPFDLYLLINFSDIPLEGFFIKVLSVGGDEGSEEKGDLMLFRLRIREEFQGTVENSTIVEGSNNKQIVVLCGQCGLITDLATHSF